MENVESKGIETTKKTKKRLPFPNVAFEDALEIANAIWQCSSGQKVRRLTLFDHTFFIKGILFLWGDSPVARTCKLV